MSGATEDTPRPSPPSSAAEGEARLSLGPWRHFSRVYGQPSSRREGRSERRKTPRDCSRREEAGRSPEEEARLCRTTRRGREGAGRSADTRRGRARRRGRDDARLAWLGEMGVGGAMRGERGGTSEVGVARRDRRGRDAARWAGLRRTSRASDRLGAAMRWLQGAGCWRSPLLRADLAWLRAGARAASGNPGVEGELQGELDRFGGVSVHLARHRALHGLDAAAFRRLLQGKCGSRAPETRAERAGSEVNAERTPRGPLAVTWKFPQPRPGLNPGYSSLQLSLVRCTHTFNSQ